jgi:hypothetical protein
MPGTVIVFSGPSGGGVGGGPDLLGERIMAVSVDTIRKNLEAFGSALREMIPDMAASAGGFTLKAFEVAVGVDGKGQVGFLGTGAEAGANATLTLKFER